MFKRYSAALALAIALLIGGTTSDDLKKSQAHAENKNTNAPIVYIA